MGRRADSSSPEENDIDVKKPLRLDKDKVRNVAKTTVASSVIATITIAMSIFFSGNESVNDGITEITYEGRKRIVIFPQRLRGVQFAARPGLNNSTLYLCFPNPIQDTQMWKINKNNYSVVRVSDSAQQFLPYVFNDEFKEEDRKSFREKVIMLRAFSNTPEGLRNCIGFWRKLVAVETGEDPGPFVFTSTEQLNDWRFGKGL